MQIISNQMGAVHVDLVWTPESWGSARLIDYTSEDVLTSGSKVTTLYDQGPNGYDATQANASYQSTLVAGGAGGHPYVLAEPGKYYTFTSPDTDGNLGFMFCIDDPGYSKAWSYFMSLNGGGTGVARHFRKSSSYDQWGAVAGSDTALGDWASYGWWHLSSYVWQENGTANTVQIYQSGVLDRDLALTGGAGAGGTGVLFSSYFNYTGDGLPNINIYRFCVLSRVPTALDRSEWFGWTLAQYGV